MLVKEMMVNHMECVMHNELVHFIKGFYFDLYVTNKDDVDVLCTSTSVWFLKGKPLCTMIFLYFFLQKLIT
jgi:hypothetical protein